MDYGEMSLHERHDDIRAELAQAQAERDAAIREQHRLMRGMVNAGRELDEARAEAAAERARRQIVESALDETKTDLARLRRLVRVALARGFVTQELREEVER